VSQSEAEVSRDGPLAGIRMVEVCHMLAGPLCGALLGDLGADVIKVEPLTGDQARHFPPKVGQEGALFLSANRNKRSLAVNLRRVEGREVFARLVATADVVVQNLRSRAARRLSVDYDSIIEMRQDIVYCAISPYGPSGPDAEQGGFDLVLQGRSGLMSITGQPSGRPVRAGSPICDIGAAMLATIAIEGALLKRERTGQGERVDVSLLDTALLLQTPIVAIYLLSGVMHRCGNSSPFAYAESFCTADGEVTVVVHSDRDWYGLCAALDLQGLAGDTRFASNQQRIENAGALTTILQERLRGQSSEFCISRLRASGVLCGPVQDYAAVFEDPQVLHADLVASTEHPAVGPLQLLAPPFQLGGGRSPLRPPPILGQHSVEILSELGLSAGDIDDLVSEEVVKLGRGSEQERS
jgi:crotonobetainyl-CoA:carnitine CoA-transferase CaiB-like acyl-CoA transferase